MVVAFHMDCKYLYQIIDSMANRYLPEMVFFSQCAKKQPRKIPGCPFHDLSGHIPCCQVFFLIRKEPCQCERCCPEDQG